LLLGGSLESLPWKGSTAKVEHDITQGFHVVTTRLLWTLLAGGKVKQYKGGYVPTPKWVLMEA
jgi:hypothetical protein